MQSIGQEETPFLSDPDESFCQKCSKEFDITNKFNASIYN